MSNARFSFSRICDMSKFITASLALWLLVDFAAAQDSAPLVAPATPQKSAQPEATPVRETKKVTRGLLLCGWKDKQGKAVYMLVPVKYQDYYFDDLKAGKGDDPKFWEDNDQKHWKGLLQGEAALLKALGELPKEDYTVGVEYFVNDYAVTDPKVLEQVKATAKATGLTLYLDEKALARAAAAQKSKQ
jgi:hypothetical protein